MMATNEEMKDNFLGRSGLLVAFPNLVVTSAAIPEVILMVTIVPKQYDNRNRIEERQDDIAMAGSKLGAPSREHPC